MFMTLACVFSVLPTSLNFTFHMHRILSILNTYYQCNYLLKILYAARIIHLQRHIKFLAKRQSKDDNCFTYFSSNLNYLIKIIDFSQICISFKKCNEKTDFWIRENFQQPVFNGFTCFEMS